ERLFGPFRRDEIQESPLIVLAPAAPVRQLSLPFLEGLERHQTLGFLGRGMRGECLILLLRERKDARDEHGHNGDGERADPSSIQHGSSLERPIFWSSRRNVAVQAFLDGCWSFISTISSDTRPSRHSGRATGRCLSLTLTMPAGEKCRSIKPRGP